MEKALVTFYSVLSDLAASVNSREYPTVVALWYRSCTGDGTISACGSCGKHFLQSLLQRICRGEVGGSWGGLRRGRGRGVCRGRGRGWGVHGGGRGVFV